MATLTTTGVFTVKSTYDFQVESISDDFPRKIIWHPKVPSKIGFFMWTAYHRKILTIDNLKKRGN
ncbi:Reverse transcriptase zinc-binding domain [Macleaya cordata]|uniref:Reverse transcriptase zinc-binding domain n=1 Tax=Macleaya cordata TaxID=56857 RepID=A0A200R8U2_MACCD|nr:Reverse transcriptase zinc-binding domain [Macleaya cordata]